MAREHEGGAGEAACGAASLLLPLALYLATAAPAPTWLDSGELLAVGYVLGGAHPPGHPIYVVLLKLATLLPLGPVALRAAALSALSASLSTYLLFRVALAVTRAVEPAGRRWVGSLFALLAALALGSTPALWGQATRIEVYATQLALVLAALLALTHFALGRRGSRDGRLLASAAFAFGLALANHHLLALLLLPGAIVLLTEDALASWRRTLRLVFLGGLPAVVLGLAPYAHLVLRAGSPGAVSLGTASSPAALLWVVSARAFQRSVVEPPVTVFSHRAYEAAMVLLGQLGPVVTVLALGGLYFLCRQRPAYGLLVVLWMVGTWLARSWMGLDPQNPDALGYLLVAAAAFALGAARIGPLALSIVPARETVRFGAVAVAAVGLVLSTTWSAWGARRTCDLSDLRGAEVVATEQIGRLPPRSVVVTDLFQTCFNLWADETVEVPRPDIAHFHLPFVGYPGYAHQVDAEHRDLRGLLRAALSSGGLGESELSALAQRRPVFVEPAIDLPLRLEPFLLPSGLVWEASAEPLGDTDLRLAVGPHVAAWEELLVRVGPHPDEQTGRVLLWRLYVDSLHLARRGEREGARAAVGLALRVAPGNPDLERLRDGLGDGEGRLDVTPFLPEALRPRRVESPEPGTEPPDVLDF